MQVIAWIMGEYGAKTQDQKKVMKIIDNLCEAAYRNFEDEVTRGYILTAITKLHASQGYTDDVKVENVMADYAKSKHIDVQQRSIEYNQMKQLFQSLPLQGRDILLNTPLNEGEILSFGFDFELSFLNTYVQKQQAEGKKGYDARKKMAFGDMSGLDTIQPKELNFGPYSAPQKGFNKSMADAPQSNPLFMPREQPVNADEGLQTSGVRKVWG